MAVVRYGDGTKYGDVDAYYGRIDADLSAAQLTHHRETGLEVSIIDENVNQWSIFAGAELPNGPNHFPGANTDISYSQQYWSFRGQADMCVLDNGNIVRVRLDVETRVLQIQEITDPIDAGQWTSWSTYSGATHYGCAVAPDGNNPIVYGIRSGGLYRNNTLVWSKSNLVRVRCHMGADGRQQKDALWLLQVSKGVRHERGWQLRKVDIYVTENILSITPDFVNWNYVWRWNDVCSITRSDGRLIRITTFPQYTQVLNNSASGDSTVSLIGDDWSWMDDALRPRLIRGLPTTYGKNRIGDPHITKLGEYYYLFYREIHRVDVEDGVNRATSQSFPIVWQRSKNGEEWSEPVHTGVGHAIKIAGVAQSGDWVYLAGNGRVWRRPANSTIHDITNYVTAVEWESPRSNQTGIGSVSVANPDGVNDYLTDLIDKRIIIRPGIKTGSGYQFAQLEDLWSTNAEQELDGSINRIKLQVGNLWKRLENPFRDVYNFIGLTDYFDFADGRPNELFHYYFEDINPEPEVSNNRLVLPSAGAVLWTGWKGYNPFVQVRRSGSLPISIVYRWVDRENHMRATYDGNQIKLYEVVKGTATQVGSTHTIGSVQHFGIRVVWKIVEIWVNGSYTGLRLSSPTTQDTINIFNPGYAGILTSGSSTIWKFRFIDQEFNFTTQHLIRQALALGDYHTPVVGSSKERQYALTWGPQTDIDTPAAALRQFLEAEKLELVWRDGLLTIGKFTSKTPIKTLEDRIISTVYGADADTRINTALIDGNEHSWLEVDVNDIRNRDRAINAYFDAPELKSQDTVRERALEEIRRSKLGRSPGGTVPLYFDLWRMDPILWVDSSGRSRLVRIEGIKVNINQSTQPSQRAELDTSIIDDE